MTKDQLLAASRATNSVPRIAAIGTAIALLAGFCAHAHAARAPRIAYEIVATHPHDARAFTQGLAVLDGKILESSGLYRESALWLKTIDGGKVRRKVALDGRLFGEGVATDGSRIVQLTWQSGVALVYDLAFNRIGTFAYAGEGWGLAFDGRDWLMSDGSDRIVRRSTRDFAATGELRVRDDGVPVAQLNELEVAHGVLYANVWHSDRIAAIDPQTGIVRGWMDLSALQKGFGKPPDWNAADNVLNGIAFNPANGHFYVTGKRWPVLYEIRLTEDRGAR
jgi:glutaminyl-peptide cyclotransferase